MNALHQIKADHILNAEDRELLTSLNDKLNLEVIIIKEEKMFTNKRAFKQLRKDRYQKNILFRFAKRLQNQFGDEIKLRIIRKDDCQNFILEKINFN
ncbi:hypothetical protein EIZ47_08525 [Chryseobacterium lacus]|uniref:Uncharacterized protein n=1 Tax=Chryseobacterium lacus TaxID=2058346 RepID=A0A368MYQ8_9FLAO|nr:hypothetical protein [Chryseobacterium lacus]RCU42401.1 hypothetical protein DQ356_08615 [Chryseobacterium lacus]RST26957.1 hypothetical protein EIZ47_08525 [Chryseobacterium lacus]